MIVINKLDKYPIDEKNIKGKILFIMGPSE
jgi:hypothetical protein